MNNYEILKPNESLLHLLNKNGVSLSDVNNLSLYDEYCEMKRQGLKVRYIAITLAEKYKMTDRAVFKIVKRLSQEASL